LLNYACSTDIRLPNPDKHLQVEITLMLFFVLNPSNVNPIFFFAI